MSAGGIAEFLNELSETDSLVVLREAYSRQSVFVFKPDNQEAPIKLRIGSFTDKRIIVIPEPSDFQLPLDKEYSIKFNVGTEIYFLKTIFKIYLNRFFIDMNTKVIQLKRRKEPRYNIPKGWNQTGYIITSSNSAEQVKCNVIDISNSGIRLELLSPAPMAYQRDDILNIRFQIHKRGEVSTMAIVRFALNRPQANTLLGLEFANISDVQNERVHSIVEDIRLHLSLHRN